MNGRIEIASVLSLFAVAACVDAQPPAPSVDDGGEESGGEPELLEPAVVREEPAPAALPDVALDDVPAPGEPPPERDDSLAFADVPHVLASSGTTATNDFHDQFGHAIVTGRFASLLDDSILVAAPYDDSSGTTRNSGKFYHFVEDDGEFVADEWQSHGEHNGRAGWAFAVGDFNDDLYDDVAVGMPWNQAGTELQAGEVAIYRGSSSGLTYWITLSQATGGREYGDRFGAALATGDFDNDGEKDDLAVGSPGEDDGRGAVYVFRGVGTGMNAFATLTETGLGTRSDHEHFGATLAAGDLRGSAHDDLLVSAPTEAVSDHVSGQVFLYTGANAGMSGVEVISPALPQHDQAFGRSLAIGDFDDDGDNDVVIGAPGANRTAGNIVLLRNSGGNSLATWTTLDESVAGHTPEFGDRFGHALAVGDIDDDGRDDVVVGAPGEKYNDGSGLVFAFRLPSFIWSPVGSGWRSQAGLGANEGGDRFGATVAVLERAGGDALLVGAPSETLGNGTRSGAVFLYDGAEAFDAWQWISQD